MNRFYKLNGGEVNTKRFLYFGLVMVALMIVTACSPQAAPQSTATLLPPTNIPSPLAASEALVPSNNRSAEVAMGLTENGAPYRGDVNAPVTLLEYTDFQ